jgi:hypothetical protein
MGAGALNEVVLNTEDVFATEDWQGTWQELTAHARSYLGPMILLYALWRLLDG